MKAPTDEQLDSLAAALIPTTARVSEYGFSAPEPAGNRPHRLNAVCSHCGKPVAVVAGRLDHMSFNGRSVAVCCPNCGEPEDLEGDECRNCGFTGRCRTCGGGTEFSSDPFHCSLECRAADS